MDENMEIMTRWIVHAAFEQFVEESVWEQFEKLDEATIELIIDGGYKLLPPDVGFFEFQDSLEELETRDRVLLTRVEAANDPEVQEMVRKADLLRQQGDDRISMEVGFGAVIEVTDDE